MEHLTRQSTTKLPAERFTGDAWLDLLALGTEPSRLTVGLVRFAPSARTAWHRHAVGQTLHCVSGTGVVATRDGTVLVLRAGDTVHTPPGEWHWHGAAPDAFMEHLAISEGSGDAALPDVEWVEHVGDEEYRNATGTA